MTWINWYLKTATIVGIPVTLWLVAMAAKLGVLAGSCALTGHFCQEEQGGDRVASAMGTLLETYPDYDVAITKPNKR